MLKNSSKDKGKLYMPPVEKAVSEIKERSNKKIFLLGEEGTGKSVVLRQYLSQSIDVNNPVIDATIIPDKYMSIYDFEVASLHQIISVIKNILNYIKINHANKYYFFSDFEMRLDSILEKIETMFMFCQYDSKYRIIGKELCQNPERLLEEFLSICTKYLDFQTITLVLDNFDTFGNGGPSKRYQECAYNLMGKYLNLIMTISDNQVLNSVERLDNLSNENDIITLDYSKNVQTVKEILDSVFLQEAILKGNMIRINRVGLILSDETIALMIQKTNGNLFDMIRALRELYNRLNELTPAEYDSELLKYIDTVINRNPIFTGEFKRERKLFIK